MGCHMLLSDGVAKVLKGRAGRAGWLAGADGLRTNVADGGGGTGERVVKHSSDGACSYEDGQPSKAIGRACKVNHHQARSSSHCPRAEEGARRSPDASAFFWTHANDCSVWE